MKNNYVSYICLKPFGSFEFYIIQMLGKMKGYRYVFDIWGWLIAEVLFSDLVPQSTLSLPRSKLKYKVISKLTQENPKL